MIKQLMYVSVITAVSSFAFGYSYASDEVQSSDLSIDVNDSTISVTRMVAKVRPDVFTFDH
ncbi:MAG: hypothetical protein MRY32_06290 [Rickettsiales bacterium]|nr:hypothetical protein [Rickettsiales bacterium]